MDNHTSSRTGAVRELAIPAEAPPGRRRSEAGVSIHAKLTVFVAAIVILTASAGTWIGYDRSRDILLAEIQGRLMGVAEDRREAVARYGTSHLQRLGAFASRPQLGEAIGALAAGRIELQAFRQEVEPLLIEHMQAQTDYRAMWLADETGCVIATTDPSRPVDVSGDPSFVEGLARRHMSEPRMHERRLEGSIAAPAMTRGQAAPDGRGRAVLMAAIDLDGLVEIVGDRTGLPKSGEVLLGARTDSGIRYLLPPAREPGRRVATAGEDPAMAAAAIGQRDFLATTDYAGRQTLAAYLPLEFRDWGLVVKIDREDAYLPIARLRASMLQVYSGILAAGLLASYLLARRFTRPIESLARAEAALAAGDWRARAPVPARDEIGRLAVTFNRMAAELQRSHEELERRVEERTAELVRSREALGGSERRLQSILDNTTAVIYVKDVEGRYLLSNREHENLFKIRRAEVQGKTDADIFPAEIAAAFRANDVKVIQGGEALEFEEIAPGSDGPHTYISIKFPLRDAEDRIYAVCGISTDITERKRAERELIRAKAELERSNRDLDRFASVASHDLQEPARMVGSYCELLVKRCGGKLDEESEKYLHHAADGAERMQRMVRDLLAYARLGSRGGLIAPTESGGALDRALANLAQAIEESGAEVTRGEMPRVRADGAQLTQVFQNLIGNSIRFRSEAPPRISVIAERVDGDWVFRVSDNGIGMDARDTERIFGVFQRLHGRRRYPGSGIGLAICRRAIERLGGRIWAESTPGRGSVFHFTIPAELAPPEAPADAARPPSAAIGG